MADPKTEAGRISELIALHRKDGERFHQQGNLKQGDRDLRHATTLERFALPLALEVDRLRGAVRWSIFALEGTDHNDDEVLACLRDASKGVLGG